MIDTTNDQTTPPEGLLKRRIIAVLSVLLILAAAKGINTFTASKADKGKPQKPNVSSMVDTLTVLHSNYTKSTTVTGRIESMNRIDIVPEVSGVLLKGSHPFRAGTVVRRGQLLFGIDVGSARFDLLSQKSSFLNQLVSILPDIKIDYPDRLSTWENYLSAFNPEKNIKKLPVATTAKERYFLASRNITATYYAIKSAEEKVRKFRVYAPFSGVITATTVTSGSRVSMGQKMGEFSSGAPFELKADVPVSVIAGVSVGDTIELNTIDGSNKSYKGTINRVNKQVSQGSQTVLVSVRINEKSLLEGSYLQAEFGGNSFDNAVTLPSRFIYDGDRVAFEKEGETQYTQVMILSQGDGKTTVLGIADSTLVVRR